MTKKSRADFLYQLYTLNTQTFVLIWEVDMGNRSVTNDMENVVDDIINASGIIGGDCLFVYRDSLGRWDGWEYETGEFYPIEKYWPEIIPLLPDSIDQFITL